MRANSFLRASAAVAAAVALAGCAAPDFGATLDESNALAAPLTRGASATLSLDPAQREQAARDAADLLSRPLTADAAVQLALANSPAFLAALATHWGALAAARQRGLPGGVVFSFERMREAGDLELGRLLSVGLMDLLTLPQRRQVAGIDEAQVRLQMAGAIADQAAGARRAWVRAVAAEASVHYAAQVKDAADAGAELARRMREAGNFSQLQAARQHLFYAEATARLAAAQQGALSAREALVRQLGLDAAQAQALQLPDRLPPLPGAPRTSTEVGQALTGQRLDVRLARQEVEAASRGRSVDLLSSLVDVELGGRHDTNFGAAGERTNKNGFELDIALPLFDWGATRRAALDARQLAAANRYEAVARAATSQAREGYAAYLAAYAQARHQRDALVPLRKAISQELLLRYNGMLASVFDLLADAREQIAGVNAALEAQRDFWLADAQLSATLLGRPQPDAGTSPTLAAEASAAPPGARGH